MDWQKMLSEMSITTGKPVSEGILTFAMILDLYKETKNPDLKKAIEENMILMLKSFKF